MRYASIRSLDVTNGEGVGVSLFVQGCPFHCVNCFNPNTWDFNAGKEWTLDTEKQFLDLVSKPHVQRVSILGGEPLANQNQYSVFLLCSKIKQTFPNKKIWLYTGYTYENILHSREKTKVLCCVDILVDGQYIDEQRDVTLPFRGSKNQRLIDVKQTLEQNKIITIQND
jgi:anaerobic ribonucleoside-triphosphate reductase activating protein